MTGTMAAFRCTNCSPTLNWPPNNAYTICPNCGGKTAHMPSVAPMSSSEAKQARFEAFYRDTWPALRAKQEASALAAIRALPEVKPGRGWTPFRRPEARS